MTANRWSMVETDAGFAAIGWNDDGLCCLRLPSRCAGEATTALLRRVPDAVSADPPAPIGAAMAAVARYFAGEQVDFSSVRVAMGEHPAFFDRVYGLVRQLGWGETATYGEIAKRLGAGPEAAREVGRAMAANPVPLIVPCHRVTAANGGVGGFSAPGGAVSKARMLAIEGVAIRHGLVVRNLRQPGFDF